MSDQFTSANSDRFFASNLDVDTSRVEGWRKLAYQLDPSKGAGSGAIDPTSVHNDAQWIRLFSIVFYKSGVTGAVPPAAQAPVGGARVVFPFGRAPWPRRRDAPPSTTLDDVNVSATADPAQPPTAAGNKLPGIDVSRLRCVFNINKTTNASPNVLFARIYNLKPETEARCIEYTRVQIHAGYKYANYGLIFDGKVVQFRRGKENPVDTYLEVHAGDGDDVLNGGTIAELVPKDKKEQDMLDKYIKAMQERGQLKQGSVSVDDLQATLLRDRVTAGTVKNEVRSLLSARNMTGFLNNGTYNVIRKAGYMPGEVVILSPKTGLVGMPEVTPQGIQARCLLNPRILLGGLVEIKSNILSGVPYTPGTASKTDAQGNVVPGDPGGGIVVDTALWGQQLETAYTSPTGRYKVLLMNYNGDTWGNPWYCDLICVALDSNNTIMVKGNPSTAFSRASREAVTTGIGATPQAAPQLAPYTYGQRWPERRRR